MMTFTTRAAGNSVAYNWLAVARHYLGGHRAIIVLAIVAVVVGAALNWSWLAAVGVAPVLLSALPCLVMCGLGLCMNRLVGRSCASASSSHEEPELLYILEGSLEVFRSSGWMRAGVGEVVLIPGNIKHALRNSSSVPMTWLW